MGRFELKIAVHHYIPGAAIHSKIALGALFPDSHGYHMFGAGGEVSLGVKVVFELFMGFKKAEGVSLQNKGGFKVNLALPPDVVFEIEWLDADSKGQQSLNGLHGDMVEECVKTLFGFLSGRPVRSAGWAAHLAQLKPDLGLKAKFAVPRISSEHACS
eukprot:jgi/Ulvmu1/3265/UM151_0013.1